MVIDFESGWYFLVEVTLNEDDFLSDCKSLMVIDFESGWYFLVERHVIEAVRV